MTSVKKFLQNACAVNGLGTSGSSTVLLHRFVKACDKTSKTSAKTTKAPDMFKHGRLSAKQYFEQIARKKLKKCTPQLILQRDGSYVLKKIKKYVENPDMAVEVVKKVSKAATSLCMWVHAMDVYSKVAKEVAPKKAKLEAEVRELLE